MAGQRRRVNLLQARFGADCLRLISPADAWNHMVLPLFMAEGRLVCATADAAAATAAELLRARLTGPFDFLFAESHLLEQFIAELYQYEGVEIAEP